MALPGTSASAACTAWASVTLLCATMAWTCATLSLARAGAETPRPPKSSGRESARVENVLLRMKIFLVKKPEGQAGRVGFDIQFSTWGSGRSLTSAWDPIYPRVLGGASQSGENAAGAAWFLVLKQCMRSFFARMPGLRPALARADAAATAGHGAKAPPPGAHTAAAGVAPRHRSTAAA
ncbi:hypothetical protein D3C79_868960 [compost metagenome]